MRPPIALFCFRRPDHLRRTLEALAENHGAPEYEVVAFADGPRGRPDVPAVEEVRSCLESWSRRGAFRSFRLERSEANLGLRQSIVRGVAGLCAERGQVIVLEDDMVTAPWFLDYCHNGLQMYAGEPRVAALHGYAYPARTRLPEAFFLRGADCCWGWATWDRAWRYYCDDAACLLRRLTASNLTTAFDHGGSRPLAEMLRLAGQGGIDSWAIRWHASAFLEGMLTLHLGASLVRNIGLDSSGTHVGDSRAYDSTLALDPMRSFPGEVKEDGRAWSALRRFHRSTNDRGLLARLAHSLRRVTTALHP